MRNLVESSDASVEPNQRAMCEPSFDKRVPSPRRPHAHLLFRHILHQPLIRRHKLKTIVDRCGGDDPISGVGVGKIFQTCTQNRNGRIQRSKPNT